MPVNVAMLGYNRAGLDIYDWLVEQDDVKLIGLFTTHEQLSTITTFDLDFIISAGYHHRIPERIINHPTVACINIHPSYLPYNRGADPNVWSIAEGTPAGVSIHLVEPDIDTGPVIAQMQVQTDFADTGLDLHQRLEDAQLECFKQAWPEIRSGEFDADPQHETDATSHTRSDLHDLCQLHPNDQYNTKELLDILRALTHPPYENAHIEVDGETYYLEVSIRQAEQGAD